MVPYPKSISPDELAGLTTEVDGLCLRSGPKVPAEVLSDNLQFISVFGVGIDHITRIGKVGTDERGADERGIPIFNASSHENTRAVAELVVGSVFSLLRSMHEHNRQMHGDMKVGTWTKTNGQEVRGKTLGILGYGAVGSQASELAEKLNMKVIYYDKASTLRRGNAKSSKSVEEVLANSDIVSLHMPGGEENHHIIDAEKLAMMQEGGYLINAARADLVEYDALIEALESGHLAGAAIDVYTDEDYTEPSKRGDKFEHPLVAHPQVLLLPHIGGSAIEAQSEIGENVALKSVAYLATGTTTGSVNMPHKDLGELAPGTSRLINIHDNQPGALADAAKVIAENGLNVIDTAQGVKDGIGFLAFDVEGTIPEPVVEAIRAEKAVRRLRVLNR